MAIKSYCRAILRLLIFIVLEPAFAQDSTKELDSSKSYPNAYFRQFNPHTARDMIDRLPGFSLDTGSDLRGLGSSVGNVLIDGSFSVSKTGGLEEVLDRIPANAVERIDIIKGSSKSSETNGQAFVANIIKRVKSQSKNWEVILERAAGGKFNSTGTLSIERAFGEWKTSSQLKAVLDRRPLDGDRISSDETGVVTFRQIESRPSEVRAFSVFSEASRALAGGALVLNANVSRTPISSFTDRLGFDGDETQTLPSSRLFINFGRTTLDGEIGIDWSKSLENDWKIKVVSLSSFSDTKEAQATLSEQPLENQISNSQFFREADNFESILRATAAFESELYRLQSELGAEITYNRLNSDLALNVTTDTGVNQISIPTANIEVDETRAELFVNSTWQTSNKIAFETGLSAEFSELSVSGDVENTQSFFFIKPQLFLVYDYTPRIQFRVGARHTVGQLNFGDFAASASASDDRLMAGNPNLGPDQVTRASFSADIATKGQLALNMELFHEWRRDVLEGAILSSNVQGVANSGSARAWGIKATASLPISRYIRGGLFEFEAEFLDSSFNDPITGRQRGLSNINSPSLAIEFRQDLENLNLSWGLSYQAESDGTFFFADEESFNLDSDKWNAFLETTLFSGVKANLSFSAIGGQRFVRERRFFSPDRNGRFTGTELIDRGRGTFATLSLSGAF